jgi:hypothetical protein
MLLPVLLAALSALPENHGPVVFYETANALAASRQPADYLFNVHAPQSVMCAASDDINLRKAPKPGAESLATLRMGTRLKVLREAGPNVRVSDRVDRWYEVEWEQAGKAVKGFVFGGALTPLCFTADLDGDGEDEVATVSMTWEFKIRVRVMEPAKEGNRVTQVDLRPACEGYAGVEGGPVRARLVPAKDAGVPLLQLESVREMDGDYFNAWVSYSAPARATEGSPKVALLVNGLADPPNNASYDVEFTPAKKAALVTLRAAQDEEGKTFEVTRTSYTFKDGVYVETARKLTTEKKP